MHYYLGLIITLLSFQVLGITATSERVYNKFGVNVELHKHNIDPHSLTQAEEKQLNTAMIHQPPAQKLQAAIPIIQKIAAARNVFQPLAQEQTARQRAQDERDQARQELEAVQKKLAAATTQQVAAETTQQQQAAELDVLRKQLQAERLKVERLRDAQQEEATRQRAAQETLRTANHEMQAENEQLRQHTQALEALLGDTERRPLLAQPAHVPAHSNNTLDDYNDGASVISGQTFDSVPEMNDTDDEHDALSSPLITDDDLAAFIGEGRS